MAVLMPQALTDLNQIRELQSPSATFPSGDSDLYISLINSVTQFCLTRTRRRYFKYKVISPEYHDGLGKDSVIVHHAPVITLTAVYDSIDRQFDSDSLLDFTSDPYNDEVELVEPYKQIIRRLGAYFGNGQGNVRLDYTAGYSTFVVMAGINDRIVFTDDIGQQTATLTEAEYNAVTLATEVQTKMDAASDNTITCSYSQVSHRFSFGSNGTTFSLHSNTGGDRTKQLVMIMGFSPLADLSGDTIYYGDYPALGQPEDLVDVANELVLWFYEQRRERRSGKFSVSTDGPGTSSMSFDYTNIPNSILSRLEPYEAIQI